jgi:hypothetical protein
MVKTGENMAWMTWMTWMICDTSVDIGMSQNLVPLVNIKIAGK